MALKNVYTKTTSNFIFYILPVLFLVTLLLPFHAIAQSYSGPLVITKGGTYTGNWESRDSEIPAVDVRTSEPVIITNSNIRAAGYLIKSWGAYVNITVRHTNGFGLEPTQWYNYKKARHFLTVDVFRNVVVENCYMENTAGIYLGVTYNGDNTTANTIRIRYNKAKNIDGRIADGHELVQFVQLNFRKPIRNAEIAWNQVINEPNNSVVEDNISLFNTQGTSDSPIRIHNNYIQGAYPYPANETSYSGGGILAESTADTTSATRHLDVYENHLVNLGNHSMGIAGGNHIRYHHNRAINAALYPDGTRFQMSTSGIWTRDYHNSGATYANSIDNNLVGITAWNWPGDRNDWTENAWASYTNNTHYEGPISQDTEADEFTLWQQKLAAKGIVLGPNGTVASTPSPTQSETTTAAGKITREFWANVHAAGVSAVPTTNPTSKTELTLFESPKNQGDDYGQRVRGYITAPASGQYTFWIASDDHSELYLSPSEDPAKKVKIASIVGWTNPLEWTKFGSQKSVPITLEAGKRYYIEAVMLEQSGGDHLAVGWQLPDGKLERPIAGNRLSPLTSQPIVDISEPRTSEATVYPNPFNNMLVLDMADQKVTIKKLVIMTQEGLLKYNMPNPTLVNNKIEIDLTKAKLQSGVYFLRYTDSTGYNKTIRIMKE